MAEDEKKGLNPTEGGDPKADGSEQGDVTFNDAQMAEIQKMIQSQTDKTAAKLKSSYESEKQLLQEKLRAAEKEKMTEEERAKAEQAEFQTLKAQLESERKSFNQQKMIEVELADAGLPLNFAKRIHGETAEEITADVKSMKDLIETNVAKVAEKTINERLAGKSPKATEQTKNTITRSGFETLSDHERMDRIKAGVKIVEG
jgi:hypothetical protein